MRAGISPAPTVGGVVAEFISAWRGVVSLRSVKESLPSRLEHSTTGSILFSLGLARRAGEWEKNRVDPIYGPHLRKVATSPGF